MSKFLIFRTSDYKKDAITASNYLKVEAGALSDSSAVDKSSEVVLSFRSEHALLDVTNDIIESTSLIRVVLAVRIGREAKVLGLIKREIETSEITIVFDSTTKDFPFRDITTVTEIVTVPAIGGGDITTDDEWDAIGDLIVGTGSDRANRLPVGSDTQVLTADSTDSTYGVKWAAASGGTTTEEIQDIVGGMFSGNTETRISATYEDGDGTIDLVVDDMTADTQLTQAQVEDFAGGMFTGNTETGITATYQTVDNTVDLEIGAGDIVHSMLDDDAVDADNIADNAVVTAGILDANVTLDKMANLVADVIIGRANGAGTGVPTALSATQVRTIINVENGATADQTQADINGLAITTVGTIVSGTWDAGVIPSAKLDTDTAHLTETQIFTGAKTFTDTVALTGTGRITGIDTVSAGTDAASKTYVDARSSSVYKRNDATYPTTVAEFTQGGITYDFVLTNYSTDRQRLFTLSEDQTGIFYEELTRSTQLTFNVSSLVLQNSSGSTISTGTTYEIGATSNEWQSNCHGFNANYNNVAGSSLSGTNQIAVTNRSSSQSWGSSALTIETSDLSGSSPQVLADFRDGASAADFDVYYPNDASWSSGIKTLVFSLTANDGSTSDTASLTFNFKNRIFYGPSALSSLTSAQIIALANEPFAGSNFHLSATSISTSGAQYVYYCYPSRLSGTPIFKFNTLTTAFTQLTDVSVINGSGYVEDYEVYQSPNQYTDATLTLEVTS